MVDKRPGVMLYFDLEPSLKLLDDIQKGRLFSAIIEYAHYGVVPEFNDQLLALAWTFVQPSIDRDGERYQNTVQQKRIAGLKSDFKRNYAPKHGIDPDDEDAMQAYIRQRLSTTVDECRPPTTPKETPNTKPSSIPSTKTPSYPKETAYTEGKGYGGSPVGTSSEADFETLRQQKMDLLRTHG